MLDEPANGRDVATGQTSGSLEPVDERIGLVLSGWRLDTLLGRGRTARVYAGTRQDGTRAAIKVMDREFRGDETVRRRLFREATASRQVDHPSVIQVLANDVTTIGEPYIVMERLRGTDVASAARKHGGKLPARDALVILFAALDAVTEYHAQGLVHRNLSPFNIFFTSDGAVKMLDFGTALTPGDAGAQDLRSLGTDLHGYIAPELLESERALGDERTDIWSLGAVLFMLVTGHRIGDSVSAAAWLDVPEVEPPEGGVRYSSMPIPLDVAAPDLAEDVGDIIRAALAREPGDRYPSAEAMREAVDAALRTRDSTIAASSEARARWLARFVRTVYDPRSEPEAGAGAWRSTDLLREMFRLVENVLYAARRHGWDHGETEVRLQHLVTEVLRAVADDEEGIFWTVRPYSFEFRGEVVWKAEPPYDGITYNLFDAGFRTMQLLPGLDETECRDFLRWMTLEPGTDLPAEDDLATAFWRHSFDHVRSDLVSAVVLQDIEDYELLDRELQEMRADAIDHLRAGIARRLRGDQAEAPEVPSAAAAADYVISRRSLLNLDESVMSGFREAGADAIPRWRAHLATVVRRALADAGPRGDMAVVLDAWDRLLGDAIDEGRPSDAIDLFGCVAEHVNDARTMDRLVEPLVRGRNFEKVMLAIIPRTTRVIYGPELPFLLDRLPRLLKWIPESHTKVVIDALARCSDRAILGVLLDYVEEHADGFEAALGELLLTANPLLGSNIITILSQHLSANTVQALERAFESDHAKLRIQAAEVLARYAPLRVLKELRALIRHAEPHIRTRALEAIERNKLTLAAEDLLNRMTERGFHQLPIAERRAVMRAACRITNDLGEEALVGVLTSHGIVPNEETTNSRLVAIEVLQDEAITDGAVTALLGATKRRWWNTEELRAAARGAAEVVRARIDELDARLTVDGPTEESG